MFKEALNQLPLGVEQVYLRSDTQDKSGDQVIAWNRERCGSSEKAHAIMKHDLAGGTLPSGKFGALVRSAEEMQPGGKL
ncbi:hypothetical protein ACFL27_19845 [candidate division CSSED10-310 bacterium]|uniref:Uncharacterized protein n=1 Tax=candidate division CSSED10-310 bacterium TaxID=2855610 RepID=A0ABV6Z1X8_UNCC1